MPSTSTRGVRRSSNGIGGTPASNEPAIGVRTVIDAAAPGTGRLVLANDVESQFASMAAAGITDQL